MDRRITILLLLLFLTVLIPPVQASIKYTFQDPSDVEGWLFEDAFGGACDWVPPYAKVSNVSDALDDGDNLYGVPIKHGMGYDVNFLETRGMSAQIPQKQLANYFAWTQVYNYTPYNAMCGDGVDQEVRWTIYDQDSFLLWDYEYDDAWTYPFIYNESRIELFRRNNDCEIWVNGEFYWASTDDSCWSMFYDYQYLYTIKEGCGWCTKTQLKDIVIGGDDPYVISGPPHDWYVARDLTDPTLSGLYSWDGNQVYSDYMHFHWSTGLEGPGNDYPKQPTVNYTIVVKNMATQQVVDTISLDSQMYHEPARYWWVPPYYPQLSFTTSLTGTVEFDFRTKIINAGMPYGVYQVGLYRAGALKTYDWFVYKANGATVTFDKASYSSGDTVTVTSTVSSSYWDPAIYTYRLEIMNLFGEVTESVSVPSQDYTYNFDSSSWVAGDYYALLIATKRSDGQEYTLGFDLSTIEATLNVEGYTLNAYTGQLLSGPFVNASQTPYWYNTSASGGIYNLSGMNTGIELSFNVTHPGYSYPDFNFTPVTYGTYRINLSLMPDYVPDGEVNGQGSVAGVVRTDWNHDPIPYATVIVFNSTWSTTNSTNIAGYYEVHGLNDGETYTVTAYQTGYSNSTAAKNIVAVNLTTTIQNIDLVPAYNLNLTFKNVQTGLLITDNVQVVVTPGSTQGSSTNGYLDLSLAYGTYSATISSSNYVTAQQAFVMYQDRNLVIYLTPTTAISQGATTFFQPHQVRFILMDQNSKPVVGALVTATFNQSTLASLNWQNTLFGIGTDVQPLLNQSHMEAYTDSYGSIVFTMLASFQYDMHFVKESADIDHWIQIYPQQNEYTVWLPTPSVPMEMEAQNSSIYAITYDPYTIALAMDYNDTALQTTNVTFVVYGINNTMVHSKSWVAQNVIHYEYNVSNVRGESYFWGFYSMGTVWPNSTETTRGITMKGPTGVGVDLGLPDPSYYVWISFILLMLIGGIFTSERTSYFGVVLVPAMGLVFFFFGWLSGDVMSGIMAFTFILGCLMYMRSAYRRQYGTGGAGSTIIVIATYIIIISATIGLVNALGIFHSFAPDVNSAYDSTFYNLDAAQAKFENPENINGAVDVILLGLSLVGFGLKAMFQMLAAIFYLLPVLLNTFHMNATAQTRQLAYMIQIGIYILYVVAAFAWFFKPPPGEGQL